MTRARKILPGAGLVLLAMAMLSCRRLESTPLYDLGPFTLTERSGRAVTRTDLDHRVWIANFIFTRCTGPCPLLTQRMSELQKTLPRDVLLVSFTVDPEYDTPKVLSEYAERFHASADRWLFLTGAKPEVRRLIQEGFRLAVHDNAGDPGTAVAHSQKFVLVGRHGKVLAYFDGDQVESLQNLQREIRDMFWTSYLPAVNASLNGMAAILLTIGLIMIKRKKIAAHRFCMISAFGISILFLISYLTYHYHHGATAFWGTGWVRAVYLAILGSHTVLAAAVPFLAVITLSRGLAGRIEKHVRIARWTWPIWMYVSMTGVAVYVMLYLLRPVTAG